MTNKAKNAIPLFIFSPFAACYVVTTQYSANNHNYEQYDNYDIMDVCHVIYSQELDWFCFKSFNATMIKILAV